MTRKDVGLEKNGDSQKHELHCTCAERGNVFSQKPYCITLDSTVILKPSIVQSMITSILSKSLVSTPKWISFADTTPRIAVLFVIDEIEENVSRICDLHQFDMKLPNRIANTRFELFCEEFFCNGVKLTKILRKTDLDMPIEQIQVSSNEIQFNEARDLPFRLCSAKHLLASAEDMLILGIDSHAENQNFIKTQPPTRSTVRSAEKLLAIDCEMVLTQHGQELARVSIVDCTTRSVVYDEIVQPENPVTNYLTAYSGITRKKLLGVKTTIHDVQSYLLANLIFEDTILVGHSIINDLKALRIQHSRIAELTLLYPRGSNSEIEGINTRRSPQYSLKTLCRVLLNRTIQNNPALGHDSVEDALATADLFCLKLSKGIHFGSNLKLECSPRNKELSMNAVKSRFLCHLQGQGITTHSYCSNIVASCSNNHFLDDNEKSIDSQPSCLCNVFLPKNIAGFPLDSFTTSFCTHKSVNAKSDWAASILQKKKSFTFVHINKIISLDQLTEALKSLYQNVPSPEKRPFVTVIALGENRRTPFVFFA